MKPFTVFLRGPDQDRVQELNGELQAAVLRYADALEGAAVEEGKADIWDAQGALWEFIHARYPTTRGMACGLASYPGERNLFVLVHGTLAEMMEHVSQGSAPLGLSELMLAKGRIEEERRRRRGG